MKGLPEATNSLARFLLPLKSRWVYPKHHACMNSESPDVYVLDCQKLPKSFLHRFPAIAVSMDLCKHHLAVAQKTGTDRSAVIHPLPLGWSGLSCVLAFWGMEHLWVLTLDPELEF